MEPVRPVVGVCGFVIGIWVKEVVVHLGEIRPVVRIPVIVGIGDGAV